MTNELSPQTMDINSNDTTVSESHVLPKVTELDQGFVETESVSSPSSSNTEFDSADDESVVSYCLPSFLASQSRLQRELAAQLSLSSQQHGNNPLWHQVSTANSPL